MTPPDRALQPAPAHHAVEMPEAGPHLMESRLEVHYQPVVVLPVRQVVGFEALARLRRPDGTLLSPSSFGPRIDRPGWAAKLDTMVLRRAVAELARWRAASGPIATATVAVNIAPALAADARFVSVVQETLDRHGVPGSALVLELTDPAVRSTHVRRALEALAECGVRTALDDFGLGPVTLDGLRRAPVHILKLSPGFVGRVTHGGSDRAVLRVVVDLADRLGLSVVAEGVETEEQAQSLIDLGCPAAQGRLFAAPHPDPLIAARAIALPPGEAARRSTTPPPWPPDVDAAVLAAARLLAHGPDRHRAAVHAIATEVARRRDLTATQARLTSRLALVHDLLRLCVDAAPPATMRAEPLLVALATHDADPPEANEQASGPAGELAIVRLAVAVADAAYRMDLTLGAPALAAALRARAATESDRELAGVLTDLAADPPALLGIPEVLDDLDRRRFGRRGMEDRIRALVGITRILSSGSEPLELLTAGLEEARRIVGAASASLERWERGPGQLRTLLNVGQLGPGEQAVPTDELYTVNRYRQARRTLLTGLPYIHTVDDPDADPASVEMLTRLRKHSTAAVPLHHEGRVWGQLWLTTEPGDPPFHACDVELLTSVATLMSELVGQAESLDRMTRLAFSDPLTRVGNRRAIDVTLERLAAASRDTTVLLVDVDLLKQINDRFGHAAGDRALIQVADALSHQLTLLPEASVGRLGGDEFCVIAPGCTSELARAWVDGVRHLLLAARDGTGGADGVTISVGIAVSPGVADTDGSWLPQELLAAADSDLYTAKRDRRDARSGRRSPR